MGKKVNQLASKTSKNEKQLHSLIKVLRPKVYITLHYRQLKLQAACSRANRLSEPNYCINLKKLRKVFPVVEIEDQGEIPSTTTLSMDSSFYSFELCDQAFQLVEITQLTDLMQTAYDDISMFDQVSSSTNQQTDWLAYQNLESWLLDAEPYYTQHEQEVSLFDYELSGLI